MARTTMANLLTQIRGMCNAGTVDYTVSGSSYWTDDQLQQILDRYRVDVHRDRLQPIPKHVGSGTIEYYTYEANYTWLEGTDGGTAVFIIENSVGDDQGTALYSADYDRGVITFVSNTAGSAYFMTGRSFDLNRAAADIWRQKAAHFAEAYDFDTDNHSMSRSQLIKNAVQMADLYAGKSPAEVMSFYRSDC